MHLKSSKEFCKGGLIRLTFPRQAFQRSGFGVSTKAKSASVKTGSLLLDSKNTRIPVDRRSEDQRQLLHVLLEHEDVRDLATSIAKLGIFPHERLVVMPHRKRFIVLEGNRRLAAIKLLLSPDLAPTDAEVKYFRKLSAKTDLSAIAKMDVSIMPNRIAAAPVIAALHVGESKKRWSTLQQARFYRELVDEGQSVAEVAEDLGVTLGQVNNYLRTEKLYRLALTLDYDPKVRSRLEDSRFPLTTLERFLESKLGRQFLGIELDDKKGFRGVVHPDRFKVALRQVATDIATKPGLTREINDEDGFRQYTSKIKLPETKVRGRFNPDTLLQGDEGDIHDDDESGSSVVPARRVVKPSHSVVPRGFQCRSTHDRVRAIFIEIRQMSIEQQRNATGVMLRVLIDIALWSFIKEAGHETAVCDHFDPTKKKRGYDPNWTPPLRDLISYACEKRLFPGMAADGYRSVRTLAAKDADYIITIEGFNAFTHNPSVTPTAGDLRALWQRAEPMLQIILN